MREAKLLADALLVRVDRFGRDGQVLTDLRRRKPLGNHLEHRLLAVGEPLEAGALFGVAIASGQPAGERTGGGGLHVHVAGGDGAHGIDQFAIGHRLEQVSARAGFEQRDEMFVFRVHGEHQHPTRHRFTRRRCAQRVRLVQLARGRESIHIGHGEIHHDHVRIDAFGEGERLPASAAFANDRDVLRGRQHGFESSANNLVVIHQYDTN